MRTKCEDLGIREGWRFYDYRRHLVYEKDEVGAHTIHEVSGQRKVDFYKTIRRLEGVGTQLVKIFINDLLTEVFLLKKKYQIYRSKM